jgi:hypothetical protein
MFSFQVIQPNGNPTTSIKEFTLVTPLTIGGSPECKIRLKGMVPLVATVYAPDPGARGGSNKVHFNPKILKQYHSSLYNWFYTIWNWSVSSAYWNRHFGSMKIILIVIFAVLNPY